MEEIKYIEAVLIIGVALMFASLFYKKLERSSFSLPMLMVILGMLIGWISPYFSEIRPWEQKKTTEHLTELAVIISLVGAGLKIDRNIGWKSWRITWRVLAIAMPLCIGALALGGYFFMGLSLAASLLFGSAMAPTDPVLASSVQVGAPGEGQEDNVRFGLTSEAGFNDGLAFPFVHLAILLAANESSGIWWHWLSFYVVLKIAVGLVVGVLIGRLIAYITFKLTSDFVSDGLLAISLTLISYSLAEVCSGYGFIAVFIAAYTFRRFEKEHEYHEDLHHFSEQIERFLMSALMVLFGVMVVQGLFDHLTWKAVVMALIFIFVIRPLAGYISLGGIRLKPFRRWAVAFLGIRGIGSFYYIAYAFTHSTDFKVNEMHEIWAAVGVIVLFSIFIHGISAPLFMNRIGQQHTVPATGNND